MAQFNKIPVSFPSERSRDFWFYPGIGRGTLTFSTIGNNPSGQHGRTKLDLLIFNILAGVYDGERGRGAR